MAAMDDDDARTRLLDAAEALFYAHGVQAVGMDRIRAESQVPLKRLYRLFPAKETLVAAYLERRDARWTASLRTHVEAVAEPRERVAAVFDWLADWFAQPDFAAAHSSTRTENWARPPRNRYSPPSGSTRRPCGRCSARWRRAPPTAQTRRTWPTGS